MDQAHAHGHRKSIRKTSKTVGLTNREHVPRRVFQTLRRAVHQLTGESERFVARGPTINDRERKQSQHRKAEATPQKSGPAEVAPLLIYPERNGLQLAKQRVQWLGRVR